MASNPCAKHIFCSISLSKFILNAEDNLQVVVVKTLKCDNFFVIFSSICEPLSYKCFIVMSH